MLQSIKRLLHIAMGSTIGVYMGRCLWLWRDYSTHPGLYAMNSAPWHTPLLPGAVITAGILLVEGLALFLVGRRIKRRGAATKGQQTGPRRKR